MQQLNVKQGQNSDERMHFYTAIFIPAWLFAFATVANCQNIDTDRPILREVSGLHNDSLFGYSLVLHQTIANPSSRDAALRGARYKKKKKNSLSIDRPGHNKLAADW